MGARVHTTASRIKASDFGAVDALGTLGVSLSDRPAVASYLSRHRDMLPMIRRLCADAVDHLAEAADLSLEIHRDIETGDEDLIVRVYPFERSPIMGKIIDEISLANDAELARASGFAAIRLDYRR